MTVQPQGIELFIQLNPQHKAAAGLADAGTGRKIFHNPTGHHVAVLLVAGTHTPQVLQVVAVTNKFGNRQLRLGSRGAGTDIFHVQHALQIAPGGDPADAQTGGQRF
ncbi:hypothetical protein D3C80_1579160 [compost metagenome]